MRVTHPGERRRPVGNIGEKVKEVEFEDPNEVPAPAEPAPERKPEPATK